VTKKAIKILFLVVKKILSWFIFATVVYVLAAAVLSLLKTSPDKKECLKNKEIFITTNGVHLDIIIPVENLDENLKNQLNLIRGTNYVAFGWGDKQFYINTPEWSDLTFPIAFSALFLKSQTAMHVTCYQRRYLSFKKVKLCKDQMNTLLNYVSNSFKKDDGGKIQKIDIDGYAYNDSFYDANGSFSIFKTCNIWVNKALKEANIETSVWSPFDIGILYHLPE